MSDTQKMDLPDSSFGLSDLELFSGVAKFGHWLRRWEGRLLRFDGAVGSQGAVRLAEGDKVIAPSEVDHLRALLEKDRGELERARADAAHHERQKQELARDVSNLKIALREGGEAEKKHRATIAELQEGLKARDRQLAEATSERDRWKAAVESAMANARSADEHRLGAAATIDELRGKVALLEATRIGQQEVADANYGRLRSVLNRAYDQAAHGKGRERHANEDPFERQLIVRIGQTLGHAVDFNIGQAWKKAVESRRLPHARGIAELLGAINYLAAAVIIMEERPAAREEGK